MTNSTVGFNKMARISQPETFKTAVTTHLFQGWRQTLITLLLLAATMLASGCGPIRQRPVYVPTPPPQQPEEQKTTPPKQQEYHPVAGKGAALFKQAQSAQRAGKYGEAEMLLERALRIEPQNPHYWYAMAQSKYGQEKYPQTIQFCLKAESLAGTQPQVAEQSRSLLRQAQEKMVAR